MVSRRYSGYLADDESLRRPKVRSSSPRRGATDWRSVLRPPSRCVDRDTTSSVSAISAPTYRSESRSRRDSSTSRERRRIANEFSEFVDFLADEEVLDSLQDIVEDAVRKLCRVTNEKGEHVFGLHEDSCSSPDSAAWSFSYSRTRDSSSARSPSKYTTTTTFTTTTASSSSDEDWDLHWQDGGRPLSGHRVCLLDKYAARQERAKRQTSEDRISEECHTEVISGRSGDDYFFCAEHFHAWARLAETFQLLQGPKRDYFSKFKKPPKQAVSAESLHKEITNVLKRPTSSGLLLYHPGQQPFEALDFLEENKILSGLQDIINQAVHKVLEVTSMTEGLPMLNIFDEHSHILGRESSEEEEEEEEEGYEEGFSEEGSEEGLSEEGTEEEEEGEEEEEEEEGSDIGGSGEEMSGEEDETADGKKKKKKKKKKKGKRKKKKGALEAEEEEKGKKKYSPPSVSKSKQKSGSPEEPRKQKYVPPHPPKTKAKTPHEEPAHKPKYVPPPLPKPRYRKHPEVPSGEAETPERKMTIAKPIFSHKDLKRAGLEVRPPPKQAIIDFLIENAAKLILYKYNYETLLSEKLGMISVPVTKVLLEIMFGYKKIKGSGIRLSSQIDWSQVYAEIYGPHPRRPRTPKYKGDDKKKAGGKKKSLDKKKLGDKALIGDKAAKPGEKPYSMKPRLPIPGAKAVMVKTQVTPGVTKTPSTSVATKSQLAPVSTKSQLLNSATKLHVPPPVTKTQVSSEVLSKKPERKVVIPKQEVSEGPEIFEIVPPKFHDDISELGDSFEEAGSEIQTSTPKEMEIQPSSPKESVIQASTTKGTITPTEDIPKSSTKVDSGPHASEEALPSIPSKQSVQKQPSLKSLVSPHGSKGSLSALPEVEQAGQSTAELLKKASSSRRSSFAGEVSKKSSTTLPKI